MVIGPSKGLVGRPYSSYAQEKLALLTRVEAVRKLSLNQASFGYPVRLQAFVTYSDSDLPIPMGFNFSLSKPYTNSELAKVIRQSLSR